MGAHADQARSQARAAAPAAHVPRMLRRVVTGLCLPLLGLLSSQAPAQMVPRAEHALRQQTGTPDFTTVRINWAQGGSAEADEPRGPGLNLAGRSLWPHWEGRMGAVIDRPLNPLKDSFVLAQPIQGGLRVRSMHLLSDYYLEGGFRATAGLVRGETGQAWWGSGDNGGGLNLSLQRLDTLGLLGRPTNSPSSDSGGQQTMPYLGAGYSNRLRMRGSTTPWRFNADLGLITINSSNFNRISQVFTGEKNLDELVRELRLRPVVKVSVGYSF